MSDSDIDSVITLIQKKKEQLTDENVQKLIDFDLFNNANNWTETTRYNQVRTLIYFISRVKKDFKDVTRKDIETYLASRKVKDSSVNQDRITIKKFYKWFYKTEDSYPEIVKWITTSSTYKSKSPSDMLTEAEIHKLINACENERDRAVVSLLDDTGIRIGELVGLNVGDVKNDGENLSINVDGKTGKRCVGLISSSPIITELLNHHPFRGDPKAPLFITYSSNCYGKRISDHGVYCMLQVLRDRAKITKKITPHIFRHTALTRYAKLNLNEAMMRLYAGWEKNSSMPSLYTHITEKEVDDNRRALMTGQKLEAKAVERNKMLPIRCPRCGTENHFDSSWCMKCWSPLTQEVLQRDISLLEMLRSKFISFEGVDVDKMLREYQHFKLEVADMQKVLECFNGGTVVTNDVVQKSLGLPTDDCIELLMYLVTAELIVLDEDKVILLDRTKFEQFLLMQKRYVEPV